MLDFDTCQEGARFKQSAIAAKKGT